MIRASRWARWTNPSLTTLRLLPAVSPRLTAVVAALAVFAGMLPAAFAVATGALVGSIGGAVAGGFGSPAGHRLTAAIVAVVVLFVLQQVSGPALHAAAEALGRRLDGSIQARILRAALAPAGIAHLEDGEVADHISVARNAGTGHVTAKDALVGMSTLAATTLGAVTSAVVLAAYRWWLPMVLLAVYASLGRVRTLRLRRVTGALRGHVSFRYPGRERRCPWPRRCWPGCTTPPTLGGDPLEVGHRRHRGRLGRGGEPPGADGRGRPLRRALRAAGPRLPLSGPRWGAAAAPRGCSLAAARAPRTEPNRAQTSVRVPFEPLDTDWSTRMLRSWLIVGVPLMVGSCSGR